MPPAENGGQIEGYVQEGEDAIQGASRQGESHIQGRMTASFTSSESAASEILVGVEDTVLDAESVIIAKWGLWAMRNTNLPDQTCS